MTKIQNTSQNVGDLTSTIDMSTIKEVGYLSTNEALGNTVYYDGSKLLSNLSKIVISDVGSKELNEDDVKNEIDCITNRLAELIDIIIKNGWQNKQWAIDGADKLNELSVKY